MNTCCKCGQSKPWEAFTKNARSKNGYSNRCKECHKAISKKSVLNNPESRKGSCLKYYQTHKEACNAAAVKWTEKNPEKVRQSAAKYRLNHTDQIRQYRHECGALQLKRLRKKWPLKYKARNFVNNCVAAGKLPRVTTLKCNRCGEGAKHYHHQSGYERENWLDVVALCHPCHALAG